MEAIVFKNCTNNWFHHKPRPSERTLLNSLVLQSLQKLSEVVPLPGCSGKPFGSIRATSRIKKNYLHPVASILVGLALCRLSLAISAGYNCLFKLAVKLDIQLIMLEK